MIETFIGHIVPVAFMREPKGWAHCDGRLLFIAEHPDLYALIGTTYGGDGQTTFALPDLRARVPIGVGQGPGLTPRQRGDAPGQIRATVSVEQLPSHAHALKATATPGGPAEGRKFVIAAAPEGEHYGLAQLAPMGPLAGPGGLDEPHENRQPYLTIQYIICLAGQTPSADA